MSSENQPNSSSLPRGIRNNNPGNIEKGQNWRGLSNDQSGDNRFAIFSAPLWGIRALARLLINYQRIHNLRTVREIISRWAPSHENNTSAYALAVARAAGVDPDQEIDVIPYLPRIVPAIIRHENGMQPYSQELISEAISRAA